jgi:drug/metabolite transporter (DMT)-like permease
LSSFQIFGFVLAFSSTICFAGNKSFLSKPLIKYNSSIPVYIGLLIGVAITGLATICIGQMASLLHPTPFIILVFAAVGILNFVVGRQLSYEAVKNIGANQTSPLLSVQIIYAISFAVLLLKEDVSVGIIFGSSLILIGVLLLEGIPSAIKRGGNAKWGYIAAFSSALIFGFTPLLIKVGLSNYHSFIAGTFIAYVTAMAGYGLAIKPRHVSESIKTMPRHILFSYIIAGALAVAAQLLRFGALSYAPIVIVAPVLASQPVFTLLMSLKFAKDFEIFRLRTVTAIGIVTVGSVFLSIFSGISS